DHYPAWRDEGFALDVGDLGENVALAGLTERDVLLGDVLRWGEALVQVSQPRSPCYKLALHTGRRDVGPRMIATARCGWYLRVLAPGTVPTSGAVELVERQPGAPSVRAAFTVMFAADGERDLALAERVLAAPAGGWGGRTPLAARISGERRWPAGVTAGSPAASGPGPRCCAGPPTSRRSRASTGCPSGAWPPTCR